MVFSQTYGGGTPFCNTGMGTVSFTWHLKTFAIQTDASGAWGCGVILNLAWLWWKWPEEWYSIDIMTKELVPISAV